jgi:hypothetical protein
LCLPGNRDKSLNRGKHAHTRQKANLKIILLAKIILQIKEKYRKTIKFCGTISPEAPFISYSLKVTKLANGKINLKRKSRKAGEGGEGRKNAPSFHFPKVLNIISFYLNREIYRYCFVRQYTYLMILNFSQLNCS